MITSVSKHVEGVPSAARSTANYGGKVMKKVMLFLTALSLLGLVSSAYAVEMITGTVAKLERTFITVEDLESGDQVRVHFDERTEIKGKLKEGTMVEVEEEKGHAHSIQVLEEEADTSAPSDPVEEDDENL